MMDLRAQLNSSGFPNTKIVGNDNNWGILLFIHFLFYYPLKLGRIQGKLIIRVFLANGSICPKKLANYFFFFFLLFSSFPRILPFLFFVFFFMLIFIF